jgi:hypothetical protein
MLDVFHNDYPLSLTEGWRFGLCFEAEGRVCWQVRHRTVHQSPLPTSAEPATSTCVARRRNAIEHFRHREIRSVDVVTITAVTYLVRLSSSHTWLCRPLSFSSPLSSQANGRPSPDPAAKRTQKAAANCGKKVTVRAPCPCYGSARHAPVVIRGAGCSPPLDLQFSERETRFRGENRKALRAISSRSIPDLFRNCRAGIGSPRRVCGYAEGCVAADQRPQ